MESRQRRVWNQAAGERTLIRASRDAMRDFVAIEYNARARLCHTKPAAWITKKGPLSVDKGPFFVGGESEVFMLYARHTT